MRVSFVVGTLERGGAEKQLVFMLKALREMGIAANVLCLTAGEAYETEIRGLGIDVFWVGSHRNKLLRLRNIIRSAQAFQADLIQSSHFYTNVYAGAAGRYLGIRSIGAVRSDLVYEIESHMVTGNWQISLPEILITNSDTARQRLIERRVDPGKVEFLRNVVEADDHPTAPGSPDRNLRILFVGRLDNNKRPERFVHLAATLTRQLPRLELEFRIAGDGELLSALQITARELGLTSEKLKFLGGRRAMDEIYRRADILVSTSDREGTPNVVLEAMAHGLPVVATAVGGTKEILDASRGFLVEPGDEEALAKAATELIMNKTLRLRLGMEGRRYVSENHSLEGLQNGLRDIYRRLLARANGARQIADRRRLGLE